MKTLGVDEVQQLDKVHLLRVSFAQARLAALTWSEVTLEDCNGVESTVDRSTWDRVMLSSCDLRNAVVQGSRLLDLRLDRSDLSYSHWKDCVWTNLRSWGACSLAHARFENCVFDGLNFLEWSDLELETLTFERCTFLRCDLRSSQRALLERNNHVMGPPAQTPASPTLKSPGSAPAPAPVVAPSTHSTPKVAPAQAPLSRFGVIEKLEGRS